MRWVTLCAALATAATLFPAGAQAGTTHVRCGETIRTDTRLAADVTNCADEGIVIGADDITLDLDGHTVSGDGAAVPSCPEKAFCEVGIDNTAGHTGVTIRHGSVRGFDVGVLVIPRSSPGVQGRGAGREQRLTRIRRRCS